MKCNTLKQQVERGVKMITFKKPTAVAFAVASALSGVASTHAFAAEPATEQETEVIVVTGMLSSLKSSMLDKKESDVVSDGIAAEDLGKFPRFKRCRGLCSVLLVFRLIVVVVKDKR